MESKHQEDLSHIRSMMERSSRFISLSGLSGIFAGTFAIIGGLRAYQLLGANGIDYVDGNSNRQNENVVNELFFTACVVLILALTSGIYFTLRKSRKYNLPIWTTATKKMLLNLSIPLIVGGVFCIALIVYKIYFLIAPASLLFYGLALINAEQYTFSDVKYLGISEIVLGCIALFLLGYGLIFWLIGFGVLHILYGLIMYKKYK